MDERFRKEVVWWTLTWVWFVNQLFCKTKMKKAKTSKMNII